MSDEKTFDSYFRFKVGDMILERVQAAAGNAELEVNAHKDIRSHERWKVAVPSVVLERKLIQCHGGIQAFYTVRRYDDTGRAVGAQLSEHEVVSFDESLAPLRELVQKEATTEERHPR